MKTLKELNSKWYWRLLKVLYFGFIIIVVISVGVISSDSFYKYNPEDIKTIEKKLDEQYENYRVRQERIDNLSGNYSSGNIRRIATDKSAQIAYIMQILIKDEYANIEGVYGFCDSTDIRCFPRYQPEGGPYESYLEDGIQIGVSKEILDIFKTRTEKLKLYNIEKANYTQYEILSAYRQAIDNDYYLYEDYLGPIGVLKSLGVGLVAVLFSMIFTYLLRFILYYIILGKFRPEE